MRIPLSPRFDSQRKPSPRRSRPRPAHQPHHPNHFRDTISSAAPPHPPAGNPTTRVLSSASLYTGSSVGSTETLHHHRLHIVSPIKVYKQQRRGATKCLQAHARLRGHVVQKRTPLQHEQAKKLVSLLFQFPSADSYVTHKADYTTTDSSITSLPNARNLSQMGQPTDQSVTEMTVVSDLEDEESSSDEEEAESIRKGTGIFASEDISPVRPSSAGHGKHFNGHQRVLMAAKISKGDHGPVPEAMRSPKSLALRIDMTLQPLHGETKEVAFHPEFIPPPFLSISPVFRHRLGESDSAAFFDTDSAVHDALVADWTRLMHEPRFGRFILETDEEVAGHVQMVEDEMAECREVFQNNYAQLLRVFDYCCAIGGTRGKAAYSISPTSYSLLLAAVGVTDTVKLTVEDEARIFTVVNLEDHHLDDEYHPAHRRQDQLNSDHCLMRFEFMEALVRLAVHRYGYGQEHIDVSDCLEELIATLLGERLPPEAALDPNNFRKERFYTKEVEAVFKHHLAVLRLLFERYADEHTTERGMKHRFGLDEALNLMHNAQISGYHMSIREVRLAFFKSRMVVANEILDWEAFTSLPFTSFLEFLARCADAMSIPTDDDMEARGVSNLLDFFAHRGHNNEGIHQTGLSKEHHEGIHQRGGSKDHHTFSDRHEAKHNTGGNKDNHVRRPSVGIMSESSRPLASKLDHFLKYLFGRVALYDKVSGHESHFLYPDKFITTAQLQYVEF
jgi:hypothetical protein